MNNKQAFAIDRKKQREAVIKEIEAYKAEHVADLDKFHINRVCDELIARLRKRRTK